MHMYELNVVLSFTSADFVFQVIKAHFTGLAHVVDLPGIQWVDTF